jgi:hypothetical protein
MALMRTFSGDEIEVDLPHLLADDVRIFEVATTWLIETPRTSPGVVEYSFVAAW